jgi:hypothetical protein
MTGRLLIDQQNMAVLVETIQMGHKEMKYKVKDALNIGRLF